ncbi:MAG TPA: malonyl-ACP O-methyltransferase BioC [Gammaproteobacteria bacterium]|nr:malonyl-ACP O-methyltransferase BioC [Gammaproteobacteria bacterium]
MNIDDEFQLDRRAMRQSFDRAATSYDAVAVLQREVQSRLIERLDFTTLKPTAILDAGAGTGTGARELASRYPDARLVKVDIAERMLRADATGAVCGDIETLPFADSQFDLVWSNLAVQWLADPDRGFGELRRVLNDRGLLLFSTFGPDTLKELRAAWSDVDGFNHVNRFLDMHDLGDALVRAGFAEPVMDTEQLTLTYEDLGGLLRDLKGLGAHNVTAGRPRGLTGRARLKKLESTYEQWRRDERLPATWEVVYGTAWAPMTFERAVLAHQGSIAPGDLRELLQRERHGKR